jgi:flagellar basal body-associated protein FliL
VVLVLALGAIILGGTLYAAFRGSGGEKASAGDQAGAQADDHAGPGPETGEAVFTNIGRLRIPLASPGNGGPAAPLGTGDFSAAGQFPADGRAALIISIAFPYSPRDRAFTEELASKVGDFRRIAGEYFSPRSAKELRSMDEAEMKAGLLGAYNSILRLGKIGTLYFNDLLIFE